MVLVLIAVLVCSKLSGAAVNVVPLEINHASN